MPESDNGAEDVHADILDGLFKEHQEGKTEDYRYDHTLHCIMVKISLTTALKMEVKNIKIL